MGDPHERAGDRVYATPRGPDNGRGGVVTAAPGAWVVVRFDTDPPTRRVVLHTDELDVTSRED
jgi:hypothetical protein